MNGIPALVFGAWMSVSGLAHFVASRYLRTLIPAWAARLVPERLGGIALIIVVSGVADILLGVLILVPATRTPGGWLAAALITGYLASHLDALVRAVRVSPSRGTGRPVAGAVIRLVVNFGYLAWAIVVAVAAH